jgi:putative transposase
LNNLGHDIGCNTIKRILLEAGMDPAPERSKRTSWSAFLRAHWGAIAAMDFFTVEAVTWAGLVRFHVLFVIDLATRRVDVAGIVHEPHEAWMLQIGHNLTDAVDGFLLKHRYVILDRDPLYTRAFRTMLASSGVESVRLPARVQISTPTPNAGSARSGASVRLGSYRWERRICASSSDNTSRTITESAITRASATSSSLRRMTTPP